MLKQIRAFVVGESYWRVRFSNGKELSELDTKPVLLANKEVRVRSVEWLEDLLGSGDIARVKEAMLCTPQGTAHFTVTEPYTVFQLSRGTLSALTGEKIKNLQLMGIVTDKDSGDCECAIWDQQSRQLYTMINNVKNFVAWREGVIPIGRLNIEALDLRGIV
jgi:hypothetical protein